MNAKITKPHQELVFDPVGSDGAVVVPAVTLMYSDVDIFDAVAVLFFTPVSSPVLSVVSVLSLALVGLVGSLWRSSVSGSFLTVLFVIGDSVDDVVKGMPLVVSFDKVVLEVPDIPFS